MKNMTSNEIRNTFLKFFEEKGHLIIPSSSLIPEDDPSLLWTNAGVAPLKKYFDGRSIPPKNRLVSVQKCIRTNDIENVGDTYHHTFFEMLGNFSIGDYFRDDTLAYSYELLTSDKYFGLDKNRLYVTVYPNDKESIERWLSLGIDKTHIIKCKGNFWDIGPGPCGPDSEIFYDRGEKFDKRGAELIEKDIDNDRFIEIWNNVFSQFNHVEGMKREDFKELPHKNIDTGMGLERIVAIIQNAKTNYDTDLFMPIIKHVEELTKIKYTDQKEFRSIADHIKTLVFALSDGALFSNEGRGYVLRRILRRALKMGRNLGINEPFMYKLTLDVVNIMKEAYPYIEDNIDSINKLIKKEEEAFIKTLAAGEKKLDELIKSNKKITGSDVFKLYDTYGFPYELTCEILAEKNIKIDKKEFDLCMENQRMMARSASNKTSGMSVIGNITDFKEESTFVGYEQLKIESKVIFIGDEKLNRADIIANGVVILDKTPFYATLGGQEGDVGFIYNDHFKATVTKTLKAPNKQNMCFINIIEGSIKENDIVTCEVDKESRFKTEQNHSATHLLQKALKEVLGDEVYQKGSYVDARILRFDFNYTGKITDDNIIEVEKKVNEKINQNNKSIIKEMSIEEAKKLGAMALFSEKYGDIVRVVKLGDSVELCGGCHVKNTGNIRRFAIKYVESKGLNVYRIEAVCDNNLEEEIFSMIKPYNDEMILLLNKAKNMIKEALKEKITLHFDVNISNEKPVCYKDILENKDEVNMVRKKVSELEKSYSEEKAKKLLSKLDVYIKNKEKGKYGDVLIVDISTKDISSLKQLAGNLLNKLDNGCIIIINTNNDSVNFIGKVSDNIKDKVNIGELVHDISIICEGNGGGSSSFAQGGGTNTDKIDMAKSYIKDKLL